MGAAMTFTADILRLAASGYSPIAIACVLGRTDSKDVRTILARHRKRGAALPKYLPGPTRAKLPTSNSPVAIGDEAVRLRAEIARLIASGLSHRKTASQLSVSLGFVQRNLPRRFE